MPLLFKLDLSEKHEVIFRYHPDRDEWTVHFAPLGKREPK